MINVVHITENPIAGAPFNLSCALNKYQSDKVTSYHIAQSDRNENRVFGHQYIIDQTEEHTLRQILERADVIHFHNFYRNQHLFRKYPKFWDIVMTKKRCWQVHSQRSTSWVRLIDALEDKNMKKLVIGQYHPREWPECEVVPNVIDIFDPALMPEWKDYDEKIYELGKLNPTMCNGFDNWSAVKARENKLPRVVYSPSRIRIPGWDNKGYDETVPTLQKLVNDRRITAEIIFNKPYAECLNRRRRADISTDEIVTGSYHLVSLESLSAGLVTVAGLDEKQKHTLFQLTGADKLPWVIARPETLEKEIVHLIESGELQDLRLRSRDWMETYWHPKQHTERFVKIYESL